MSKSPFELTPQTLIKRVMSGAKEYRSKDYLNAFSQISSTELHHSDYSRLEIIKLWNSLQNTPNKVRYFTFSLVDDNHVVQRRIKECYSHAKWAYICHDKDKSAERKHYHYVLIFEQPRSFSSIANDLEIPVTMLQKVYSKRGILDYLTHENDPNKYHYSLSDIEANFDVEQEKSKSSCYDIDEEFSDYCKLREGRMSRDEWFDKYKYIFCDVTSPVQRLQQYCRIFDSSCSGASLSSRSEFSVPNPCKKKAENLYQSAISEVFPELTPWLDRGSKVVFPSPHKASAQKKKDYRKPNSRSDLA